MAQRILHVITNLSSGGAERMLYKLLAGSRNSPFEQAVLSLIDKEHIGEEIERIGVRVEALGLRRETLLSLPRCAHAWQIVRKYKPDLIQGWMYHGNLGAYAAAKIAPGRSALVFNIRHSLYDLAHERRWSQRVITAGAKVCGRVDTVLYNSFASAEQHEAIGYPLAKRQVIPNGFELERYRPDPEAKVRLRNELGLSDDVFLIGLIGRYHPMKDHKTFVKAAAKLLRSVPKTEFVLAGRDIAAENSDLRNLLLDEGVLDHFHLLGERRDIAEVIAGLDVLTNCSAWGEGFSNVIGEACACGVPCVVTDIGEALRIVGEDGYRIPVAAVDELVEQWRKIFEMNDDNRRELGEKLRRRIGDLYSITAIINDYMELYARLLEPTKN